MQNTLTFPNSRVVNPHREIRASSTPAQVVFDFQSIYAATLRRNTFQELMGHIDLIWSRSTMTIKTRNEMYSVIMLALTEELKALRYRLDYDAIIALGYIVRTVTDRVIEIEPGAFISPEIEHLLTEEMHPGDMDILFYVFSEDRSSHPDLEYMKNSTSQLFLKLADLVWKQQGRKGEDLEMLYEHIGHTFPLVIDIVKTYIAVFRSKETTGANI